MLSQSDLSQALAATTNAQPAKLYGVLAQAIAAKRFEEVKQRVTAMPSALRNETRFQQLLGLAHRGLLDSADAYAAFQRAAKAQPAEPLLAHSLARTALEAGFPAAALFERARILAPGDASIILGHAAAILAEGDESGACDLLAEVLLTNPGWIEGHRAYARVRAAFDPGEGVAKTIRQALDMMPEAPELWSLWAEIWMSAHAYDKAIVAVQAGSNQLGERLELRLTEALCLSELGEIDAAQAIYDQSPFPADPDAAIGPIRNLIRLGRYEHALKLAQVEFSQSESPVLWPYRALLWRVLDDPQWNWLEGDPRFVGCYDLPINAEELKALADALRKMHRGSHQPLDQSVRGGTQTDGHLFARAEPEIRRLRELARAAVSDFVSKLPPPEARHPTLHSVRKPISFQGAWSVRLSGKGYHHDHVHSQGWISSAFYVALPDATPDSLEAGWLTLGENLRLLPNLKAFHTIEPRPGRLVLFPSTMWHGTRPFDCGERLTAAFDIARPTP